MTVQETAVTAYRMPYALSRILMGIAFIFFLLLTFVEAGVHFPGNPKWFLGAGLSSLALSLFGV